jgi:DNA-binding HxlR family transcriptional regulator
MRTSKPRAPAACAIHDLLPVLAGPWTLHILWVLGSEGPTRFGELRRKVDGISARMLSDRLRLLEEKGFIYREYEPVIPPSVTYGITDRMRDITKVLDELNKLSLKWRQEDVERPRKAAGPPPKKSQDKRPPHSP